MEENKDLFPGEKESKSYSSAQAPNIGNMKEGAQFAVNVCSGIILNVAKSLKESQINTNEVVNLTKKVCAEIASSAFKKDLPAAEMSQIKSSTSSPPFQGSDKDTSRTVWVKPSKTTSTEENKSKSPATSASFQNNDNGKKTGKDYEKAPNQPMCSDQSKPLSDEGHSIKKETCEKYPKKTEKLEKPSHQDK